MTAQSPPWFDAFWLLTVDHKPIPYPYVQKYYMSFGQFLLYANTGRLPEYAWIRDNDPVQIETYNVQHRLTYVAEKKIDELVAIYNADQIGFRLPVDPDTIPKPRGPPGGLPLPDPPTPPGPAGPAPLTKGTPTAEFSDPRFIGYNGNDKLYMSQSAIDDYRLEFGRSGLDTLIPVCVNQNGNRINVQNNREARIAWEHLRDTNQYPVDNRTPTPQPTPVAPPTPIPQPITPASGIWSDRVYIGRVFGHKVYTRPMYIESFRGATGNEFVEFKAQYTDGQLLIGQTPQDADYDNSTDSEKYEAWSIVFQALPETTDPPTPFHFVADNDISYAGDHVIWPDRIYTGLIGTRKTYISKYSWDSWTRASDSQHNSPNFQYENAEWLSREDWYTQASKVIEWKSPIRGLPVDPDATPGPPTPGIIPSTTPGTPTPTPGPPTPGMPAGSPGSYDTKYLDNTDAFDILDVQWPSQLQNIATNDVICDFPEETNAERLKERRTIQAIQYDMASCHPDKWQIADRKMRRLGAHALQPRAEILKPIEPSKPIRIRQRLEKNPFHNQYRVLRAKAIQNFRIEPPTMTNVNARELHY